MQSKSLTSQNYDTIGSVTLGVQGALSGRSFATWLPVYAKSEQFGVPDTRSWDGSEWNTNPGGTYDYTTYHVYPFVINPDSRRQMVLRAEADCYALWLPHPRDQGKDFTVIAQQIMQQFEALPGHIQSTY